MTEELIPTAAVFAGSPARTFEYRTAGVATTPHLRWSFSLKEGKQIACPVLASHNQVYVANSDGCLFALDASNGDVLWSFPTRREEDEEEEDEWDEDEEKEIMTFCLDGTRGYVASAYFSDQSEWSPALSELDLSSGQVLRSWEALGEGDYARALFISNDWLFLAGNWGSRTLWFDRARQTVVGEIGVGVTEMANNWVPTVYRDPQSGVVMIMGYAMVTNNGDTELYAYELAGDEVKGAWSANPLVVTDNPRDLSRSVGWLLNCNLAVVDNTLYVFNEEMDATLPERAGWSTLGPGTAHGTEYAALLALEPRTGAVKWMCDFPSGGGFSLLQLVATSQLVFLIGSNEIRAVDVQTHEQRWNWQATFEVQHALTADGLLYLLGTQGEILALDAATGERRWNFQVQGKISNFYSTIDDGTLSIATDSTLYALSDKPAE